MMSTEPVHVLTIGFSRGVLRRHKLQEVAKSVARSVLQRLHVEPRRVKEFAGEFRRRGAFDMLADALERCLRWVYRRQEVHLYVCDIDCVGLRESSYRMARDCFADLIAFEPAERQSKVSFLERAWERLASGSHIYTYVENDQLLHHAWLNESPQDRCVTETTQGFSFPPGTAILEEFHTQLSARQRGLCQASLHQIVAELSARGNIRSVGVAVPADNRIACHIVEKVGFRRLRTVFSRTICGVTRRCEEQSPPSPAASHVVDAATPAAQWPTAPVDGTRKRGSASTRIGR
jgi:hypothetical protein